MRATWWPGSRPRALVFLVITLLAWTSIASVVAAAADKSFKATLGSSSLVAGASYGVGRDPITLTITNTSNQAQLGSANVKVPDGLLLTDASIVPVTATAAVVGQTIQLRNLALQPLSSDVVYVSAQVECAANANHSYVWEFQVKQANDFNGTPGNDLGQDAPVVNTVSATCGIAFSHEPAHSEKTPTAITSAIYNPAGDPVTVSVLDGEGDQTVTWWSGSVSLAIGANPGAATLSGTVAGSATNGSVTFAPRINVSATGYSLIAKAVAAGSPSVGTDTAGLESNNFNIVDDATICGAGATGCLATAGTGQKTAAKVQATSSGAAGDLVILSINDPTVTNNCAGYDATSDVVVFNVTDSGGVIAADRTKTATLTLLAGFVNKSASKYQVCYDSGSGPRLLLACATKNPVLPCVVSKAIDKSKNLVIVVSSPAGDPKLNF